MKPKCLYCNSDKEGRSVDDGKDFVCGSCTHLLSCQTGDTLDKAYKSALRCKMWRKATALSIFMESKPREHLRLNKMPSETYQEGPLEAQG